ncbi:MAG: antibiotic biosynthesis monooxygenase family protein [Flavobacteriales bacterium]
MLFRKQPELPAPPYYAVIFVSTRSKNLEGYAEMDEATIEKVKLLDGFLGFENIKTGDDGIFISYWKSMEAIDKWRNDTMHLEAKQKGISTWYDRVLSQVCKVEHSREFIRK